MNRAVAITLRSALLAAALIVAVDAPAADDVRVYTNADLARLEPLPAAGPAGPAWDAQAFETLNAWLEQAHSRLEAQRAYELEKERIEADRQRSAGWVHYPQFDPYRRVPRLRGKHVHRDAPKEPQRPKPCASEACRSEWNPLIPRR